MLAAFAGMRQVHERLLLLATAQNLPLSEAQKRRVYDLQAAMAAPEDWSAKDLAGFGQSETARAVQAFLKSLAPLLNRS